MKRIITFVLSLTLLFSFCACEGTKSSKQNVSNGTEKAVEQSVQMMSVIRDEYDYETEYVKQHLTFVDGEDYAEFVSDYAGLSGIVADNYRDAKLNSVNGEWNVFSKITDFIANGKVELENEYDVLIMALMQDSAQKENFANAFEEKYYDSLIDLLQQIKTVLGGSKDMVEYFTGDEIEKAQDLASYLEAALYMLQNSEERIKSEPTTILNEVLAELKDKFNASYIKGNEAFIKKVKGTLGKATKLTGFISDNLSDIFEEYMSYQAFCTADTQWEDLWLEIAKEAKYLAKNDSDKGSAYIRVADSIEHIISTNKKYRENNSMMIIELACEKITENTVKEAGAALWNAVKKKIPFFEVISEATGGSMELADKLVNIDKIAYYGQMLIGYGDIASAAYEVMLSMETDLRDNKDYSSALLFDRIFNIYKNIQISCADCVVDYNTAIISNPMGYIFKYTTEDEIVESYHVLVYKAEIETLYCHGEQKIYNNGGNVVGFNGNIYYFKPNSESREKTGIFSNFSVNDDVKNDLICRSSDGQEKVLISTNALSNIYICKDKIFYKKAYNDWYSIDFSGNNETMETDDWIVGYAPKENLLIVSSGEGSYYGTDFAGTVDESVRPVLCDNNFGKYYYEQNNGTFNIFCAKENEKAELIGSVSVDCDLGSSPCMGDSCVGDDGIYFVVGRIGGTGLFFDDGTIYRIAFGSNKIEQMASGLQWDSIHIAQDSGNQYIYYSVEAYSGVSFFDSFEDIGIKRLNTINKEVTNSSLPLNSDDVVCVGANGLQVLEANKNEPTDIMNNEMIKALGYDGLGVKENGDAVYHEWAELVDGTYYVLITESLRNDSASMGWRQGYTRQSSAMYSIKVGEDTPHLIYSY